MQWNTARIYLFLNPKLPFHYLFHLSIAFTTLPSQNKKQNKQKKIEEKERDEKLKRNKRYRIKRILLDFILCLWGRWRGEQIKAEKWENNKFFRNTWNLGRFLKAGFVVWLYICDLEYHRKINLSRKENFSILSFVFSS